MKKQKRTCLIWIMVLALILGSMPLSVFGAAGQRAVWYTVPKEELPQEFEQVSVSVKNNEGGYIAGESASVAFSYKVLMDDGVLYDRSEAMLSEPDCPKEGNDHSAWLAAVKEWLGGEEISKKYPPIRYSYDLGEAFRNYSSPADGMLNLTHEGVQVGICKIEKGVLTVELSPACCFLDNVMLNFTMAAEIDHEDLNDSPQEIIIDDKGEVILQSSGTAGGDPGDADKEQFSVEKEGPQQVNSTEITYKIHVDAKNSTLNGKTLKDLVPKGLRVRSLSVSLNGAAAFDAESPEAEYTFVSEDKIEFADLVFVMELTDTEYQNFINSGINTTFKNKAQLLGDEPDKPLAESEEVSTKMKAEFLNKTGKAQNLEGTRYSWTIKLNTQLPTMDYGYLADSLCWTDHQYDFENGITIQTEDGNYTISDIEKIDANVPWNNLTAKEIETLVGKEGFNKDNPKAYYYLVDEPEKNPFYEEGNGEPEFKQRAVLIIPYKNLQGSAEKNEAVTVKYVTDLNLHGLSPQEYWDKVYGSEVKPNIDNLADLLWENKGGVGPVPVPPDKVNLGKDVQPYPGSVVKRGMKYDSNTQNLTWAMDVNKIGISMKDAVLEDILPAGTYEVPDSMDIKWYQYSTKSQKLEASGTFANAVSGEKTYQIQTAEDGAKKIILHLGDVNADMDESHFYTLVFTLKLTDPALLSQQTASQSASNKATLSYGEPGDRKAYEAEGSINVPNTLIAKDKAGAYNYYTHELPWKVTVNPNSLPIKDAVVTDVLEDGFELGQLVKVEVDGEADEAVLSQLRDQINAPGFDSSKPEFSLGNIDKPYTLYFTAKAADTWRDANLKDGDNQRVITVPNKASLDGTVYGAEIKGAEAKASNTIEKAAIGKKGVYHKETGTIDWTIDVNREQYDISGLLLEELIAEEGRNPLHELDPDSIKFAVMEESGIYKEVTAQDSDFKQLNLKGFIYQFPQVSGGPNYQTYRITFTTVLTDSAEGASIRNTVYLKHDKDNTENKSDVSNGGYDGSFDSESSTYATDRPRVQLRKVSTNTDTIKESKGKLPLNEVEFLLSVHKFSYDNGTLTIGDEVERYQKERLTDDGEILFTNIKTCTGVDGSADNDLICVLQEESPADGYVKNGEPYFIYFSQSPGKMLPDEVSEVVYDGNRFDGTNYQHNKDPKAAAEVLMTNAPVASEFSFTKQEVKLDSYEDKDTLKKDHQPAAGVKFELTPIGDIKDQVDSVTVTSDADGKVTISNLDPGRYLLTETASNPGQKRGSVELEVKWIEGKEDSPGGHYEYSFVAGTAKNMSVNGKNITDDLNTASVSFNKKIAYEDGDFSEGTAADKDNTEALAGASFRIVSVASEGGVPAGNVAKTVKADAMGTVKFTDLPIGKYEIYEVFGKSTVPGYVSNGDEVRVYDVTITDNNGSVTSELIPVSDENKKDVVYNEPVKGSLTFTKTIDEGTLEAFKDKPLAGAEFGLFRKVGNTTAQKPLYKAVSEENGRVAFENVEFGDYTLKEIKTPAGFNTMADVAITKETLRKGVSEDGQSFAYSESLANKLYKTGVSFNKKDADNQSMAGIDFKVYRRGNGAVGADGAINGLPMDLKVSPDIKDYYSYAPAGNSGVITTAASDGSFGLSNLPMGDYLLVEQEKEGLHLQDEYQNKAIFVSVEPNGVTAIKETENADSLTWSEDHYTNVDPAQWIEKDNKTVTNYKKYGFVNLYKLEAEQNYENGEEKELTANADRAIAGARFGVYVGDQLYLTLETNQAGQFAYETSGQHAGAYKDAATNTYKHLWYGDYVLKELSAPEGYGVNDKAVSFHIGDENTTSSQDYTGHEGTAWIAVNQENVSAEYVKKGETAPDKADFGFADRIKRGTIQVKKVDSARTDTVLSNAFFEVRTTDGTAVAGLKESGTAGIYKLTNEKKSAGTYGEKNGAGIPYLYETSDGFMLLPGNYTIVEVTRPGGYLITAPKNVMIADNPETVTVEMGDDKVLGSVSLKKTYTGGETPIKGVAFDLFEENGSTPIKTSYTDGSGLLTFTGIPEGKYQIRENLNRSEAADDVHINTEWCADVEITVNGDETKTVVKVNGSETTAPVSVENDRFAAGLNLKKADPEDGTGLEGVEFKLEKEKAGAYEPYGSNGGLCRTSAGGILQIDNLVKGHYRLTETREVHGYKLDKPFTAEFDVTNENQDGRLDITKNNADRNLWGLKITSGEDLLKNEVLTNERATGSVTLKKVGTDDDSDGLNGTVFKLYKEKDGNWIEHIWDFITGNQYELMDQLQGSELEEKGRLTISGLEWGSYKLMEETPSAGYKTDGAEYKFEIGRNGTDIILEADLYKIVNVPNQLVLQKRGSDIEGDTLLDGAVFTITNQNDKNDTQTVTAADGKLTLAKKLTGGNTYVLHETQAPEGYQLNAQDVIFTMEKDGTVMIDGKAVPGNIITVTDDPTRLEFKKAGMLNETCSDTDLEGEDPQAAAALGGAEFTLYRQDAPDKPAATAVSREDGTVVFERIPVGSYLIKETKAPEGHVLNQTVYRAEITDKSGALHVILDETGASLENNQVINDVYRTDIRLVKVSEQDSEKTLAGAEYGLYKSDRLIAKAVTDADGVLEFKGVLMNTEYEIRELNAPDGSYKSENPIRISYITGADHKAEIKEFDGGNGTAKLDEKTGEIIWFEPQVQVELLKTDEMGQPLGGAALQVQDEDGNVIEQWTSQEKPYVSSGILTAGKSYQLVETKAPNGYKLAEPVTFTIEDTTAAAGENKLVSVTMTDKTTVLNIRKIAEKTGKVLNGAQFKLEGVFADGNSVQIIEPGQDGSCLEKLLIAGTQYTVTEIAAPDGYMKLKKPIVLIMNEQGIPELKTGEQRAVLTETASGYQMDIVNQAAADSLSPDGSGTKTGDDTPIMLYALLALLAAAAAVMTVAGRRKQQ